MCRWAVELCLGTSGVGEMEGSERGRLGRRWPRGDGDEAQGEVMAKGKKGSERLS